MRKLFPKVPILALSATCPPAVLRDIVAILGLRNLTNGTGTAVTSSPPQGLDLVCRTLAADPQGTVLFTSPLYRKNLHYKVLLKPADRAVFVREMVAYILDRHPNETGIVYCLSRAVSTFRMRV